MCIRQSYIVFIVYIVYVIVCSCIYTDWGGSVYLQGLALPSQPGIFFNLCLQKW